MSNKSKQVIVMRKDLNMRKGKIAAQAAHASMAVLLNAGRFQKYFDEDGEILVERFDLMLFDIDSTNRWKTNPTRHPDLTALKDWLQGAFTKVCVFVNSEAELLEIVQAAQDAGLYNALITDSGLTEFNGVPTKTCAAIGPAFAERIDPVTRHLPLL
jgi:peptidyl-tRNA hydrolase, PTH2 family